MKALRRSWPTFIAPLVLATTLAACGTQTTTSSGADDPQSSTTVGTPETVPGAEDETDAPDVRYPPKVTVHFGTGSVDLRAWSFCYGSMCADGMPPANPPSVGSPDRVEITFPLEGWSFEATFQPAGARCGRSQTVPLRATDDGTFVLEPAGLAGTYDVALFGRGDGDLIVTFRWTTKVDGPMPVPEARLALLAGQDGQLDSYGVELALSDLATTPKDATATITVTAANGKSLTFDATRSLSRCQTEGTAYWDGPDADGLAAAALGPAPCTYDVVVTLDGVRHRATAQWPADVIKGNEPSVALTFAPPLPALG